MKKPLLQAFYWAVIIALLVLGLCSCGTRKKTVSRAQVDSAWVKLAHDLSVNQYKMFSMLEDIRFERLQSFSGEIVDYDTAGRPRRRTVFTGDSKTTSNTNRRTHQVDSAELQGRLSVDSGKVAKKVDHKFKDADTTVGANLPWYTWLIIGGIGLVALYLILKRFRII